VSYRPFPKTILIQPFIKIRIDEGIDLGGAFDEVCPRAGDRLRITHPPVNGRGVEGGWRPPRRKKRTSARQQGHLLPDAPPVSQSSTKA
jgi:hypothetical protein